MSLLLNIETSTTLCSVSIAKEGKIIAVKEMNEEIFKIISKDEISKDYDVYYDQLDVSLNGNLLMVKYTVITNGGGTLYIPDIMTTKAMQGVIEGR